jgi:hypothetical protein
LLLMFIHESPKRLGAIPTQRRLQRRYLCANHRSRPTYSNQALLSNVSVTVGGADTETEDGLRPLVISSFSLVSSSRLPLPLSFSFPLSLIVLCHSLSALVYDPIRNMRTFRFDLDPLGSSSSPAARRWPQMISRTSCENRRLGSSLPRNAGALAQAPTLLGPPSS